jgi:DNA invertase Pin-like site-specific DNA recombinase
MSTSDQGKGDSIRRQELVTESERFCAKEGLTLNGTLRVVGSAYHGDHVASGPLAEFIEKVYAGVVKPGSWLLVEEMDRLDRRKVNVALKQFMSLLEAGLVIRTMMDAQTYTLERVNEDATALIISIVKMSAAHDYSKRLSNRIKSVWDGRREAMRTGRGVATNACPSWLRAVDGKFEIQSDRLAILKRIVADRHLGYGRQAIATRLNEPDQPGGRVPPFRGGDGWHPSTIAALVKNKALIGTYQPRKSDGTPDGPEIYGFYPPVISEVDFWRAQWGPDNKGTKGRRTKGFANLLRGIPHCDCCQGGLIYLNTGKDQALVCGRARRNLCGNHSFHNYPRLERELLVALSVVDFTKFLDRSPPQQERITALEAEIADANATVERLLNDFHAHTPVAVSNRIGSLSAKVDNLGVELAEARRAARIAEAEEGRDAYAEFRAMVDAMPTMPEGEERDRLRMRIAAELRRMIKSARANGTELRIELTAAPWHQVEILFNRSRITSFCLHSYLCNGLPSHTLLIIPRDLLFGDLLDRPGLFAQFVGLDPADREDPISSSFEIAEHSAVAEEVH